ncbi:MAG: class I SAM-dependent methyltransferase [Actinomycetota bacterium]|nr:class I SAM-dependent methyltransferase [Actinomycetota bacterium]
MKHRDIWLRCADWVGVELDETDLDRLDSYQRWLAEEAIPAGGLGPGESHRLHDRHLGDSILFAAGFDSTPDQVLDLGSGVGLPGIPLAILWGDTRFILLDRSGRRVDLLRRAVRILELENVTVEQGEIEQPSHQGMAVVSRATLPPNRARERITPWLLPGGMAVLGGSWERRPEHQGWVTLEIPAQVLDHTFWILIMHQT